MRPTLTAALALILLAVSLRALAMMSIEVVTKDRTKALGLDIRAVAAGPDAVRVVLEFDVKGELKDFARVDLHIHQDGKLLVSTALREERPREGRVSVALAADRASLDRFTVRVVTRSGPRTMSGYDLKLKDFVDLSRIPLNLGAFR